MAKASATLLAPSFGVHAGAMPLGMNTPDHAVLVEWQAWKAEPVREPTPKLD